jgi:hypothetical protein
MGCKGFLGVLDLDSEFDEKSLWSAFFDSDSSSDDEVASKPGLIMIVMIWNTT